MTSQISQQKKRSLVEDYEEQDRSKLDIRKYFFSERVVNRC